MTNYELRFGAKKLIGCSVLLLCSLVLIAQLDITGGHVIPAGDFSYLEYLGEDLVSAESFTIEGNVIKGKLMKRSPLTEIASYQGELSENGTLNTFNINWSTPKENSSGREPRSLHINKRDGGYSLIQKNGNISDTSFIQYKYGAIPNVGKTPIPFVMLNLIYWYRDLRINDKVAFLNSGSNNPQFRSWRQISQDSSSIEFFGMPVISVSDGAKIISRTGEYTTNKVLGIYKDSILNIDSLSAYYATLDTQNKGIGIASPPKSYKTAIGNTTILIDYYQPAVRGRKVLGYLIPYGDIWRTGANAATKLTLDDPLVLGETTIPAGSYSIWSIHDEKSSKLIVNTTANTWGTNYDSNSDLARLELLRERSETFLERFKIEVELIGEDNYLVLSWGYHRFLAKISID